MSQRVSQSPVQSGRLPLWGSGFDPKSRIIWAGLGIPVVIMLVLILYPSLALIGSSFWGEQGLTLEHYGSILSQPEIFRVLGQTLWVCGLATVGATALGTGLAWVIARTDLPGKGFWRTVVLLPYMIPPFIGAIAWVYLLGRVGYLNQIWMALMGSTEPLVVLSGPIGIAFVMAQFSFPIAYLVTIGPLESLDPALEEAARMSGAKPLQVIRDVVFPLIMPSIGSAAMLIFLLMLANFGIPSVIGLPDRYYLMTTQIYSLVLNFSEPNNLQHAAALSMILVVIAFLTLQAQRWLLRRGSFAVVTGKANLLHPIELGRWTWGVVGLMSFVVLLTVVAPLGAILLNSLLRAIGVAVEWSNLTLQHYQSVLTEVPKAQRGLINSLWLAAGSATGISVLSLVIGYWVVRIRGWGSKILESLASMPFATPGTVVALALILAFLNPLPLIQIHLYNTIWILYIAYIGRFLALGVRSTGSGLEQMDPALEEAARSCGASLGATIRDVTLPLIRNSVFAGWFLAFIPILSELTVSILLASVGNETLGTVVFGLYQEGRVGVTSALAMLVTMLVLSIYGLIRWLTKGRVEFL